MALAESVIKRLKTLEGVSPLHWELVVSVLRDAAREAERWSKRPDDAVRFPGVLYEASDAVSKASPAKPRRRPRFLPGQQELF